MNIEEKHLIVMKIQKALDLLGNMIDEHKPVRVFGLFSGGHDSFSSTFISSLHPAFSNAVHINTGIGVEATRAYVRNTCTKRGWSLLEYFASQNRNAKGVLDAKIYEEIVKRYGFPGPGGHGKMYIQLKERCLHMLERQFAASCRGKEKRRVMYVGGCRRQESVRRMANVDICKVEGRRIWVNPIHDWTKLDTSHCLEHADQERNLVVDLIHKSGECLCGAFAKPMELEELNQFDITRPAYNEILRIQKEVAKCGKHAVWGTRPQKQCGTSLLPGMLCHSCK